jgi:hypothetical protein
MTTSRGRKKSRRKRPCPDCPATGSPPPPTEGAPPAEPGYNSLIQQGIINAAACSRLQRITKSETDNLIRQRRAHIDDLIRFLRNLAAIAALSISALVLVVFASMKLGVPPAACIAAGGGGATLLVRSFIKIFETVRSALPDAPKDRPSNGRL